MVHCIPKLHHLLPHLNPDWFYLSGTGVPRLSWKKPFFGEIRRIASEEVVLQLIISKCIPVILYGLEALPLINLIYFLWTL